MKRFILEIIEKHGPVARRLCNKDPFALKYMKVIIPDLPRYEILKLFSGA